MIEDRAKLLLVKWLAYFDRGEPDDPNIRLQILKETWDVVAENDPKHQKTIELIAKIKKEWEQ